MAEQEYRNVRVEDFTDRKPGRVVRDRRGFVAFVPDALPPADIPIDWELARQISEADRALSELAGAARTLPNPHLLIRPFVKREAVLSSRIEGTQASMTDLLMFEAADGASHDASDVVEVRNYVQALEFGLIRLRRLPLSLRLLREIHAELMAGVRGQHLTPGEFRRSQNWIGPPGCTLADATYVPPPVPEMLERLSDLERYLHAPAPLPPLVRLALIHYEFEAIHPFLDGNGRMGRLLITLILCAEGLLPEPLLYLSVYLEQHRATYYERLLDVSRRGAWVEWITFFLRGIAEQATDAVRRADDLLNLWYRYRGMVKGSAHQLHLVDELFARPAMTVAQVRLALGVTHRGAQLNVDKLVALGIVREATGRRRNRIFVAPEIIAIIDAASAPERPVSTTGEGAPASIAGVP